MCPFDSSPEIPALASAAPEQAGEFAGYPAVEIGKIAAIIEHDLKQPLLAAKLREQVGVDFARGVEAAANEIGKFIDAEHESLEGEKGRGVSAHEVGSRVRVLEEAATAIRALAREPETQEWRDISAAPRDGTEILLWGACEAGEGRYAPDRNVGWWGDGKWRTRHPDELCIATHWQPLPAPPASAERAKEET